MVNKIHCKRILLGVLLRILLSRLVKSYQSVVILLLLLPGIALAAVSARFERNEIRLNETVRLIIESNAVVGSVTPNLEPVKQHFTVIGQSTSQNIRIVNGEQSATRSWQIDLAPISVGSFNISPMQVGSEQTAPMRIAVLPQATDAGNSRDEIFIETELDVDTAWVQQQVLFSIRLFVGIQLLEGSITDPAPTDTVVERLGKDRQYDVSRGNKTYRVVERRYFLFPQKSGELIIPPVRFSGTTQDGIDRSNSFFNNMFNRGRKVRANSAVRKLNVMPPDSSYTGQTWLPAKKLTIVDLGEQPANFKIGEPVTRKIQLQALGLTGEQLPEIPVLESDGLRLYPDQTISESQRDGDNMIGISHRNIALIPDKPGSLTLPEIAIPWWNTLTNTQELTVLSERTIDVLPVAGQSVTEFASSSQPNVETTGSNGGTVNQRSNTTSDVDTRLWRWLAAGSFGLWLISALLVLVWWRRSVGRSRISDQHEDDIAVTELKKQLISACRQNDAHGARSVLHRWSAAQFGDAGGFHRYLQRSDNHFLRQLVSQLDGALYGTGGKTEWRGEALLKAITGMQPSQSVRGTTDGLPTLYPVA